MNNKKIINALRDHLVKIGIQKPEELNYALVAKEYLWELACAGVLYPLGNDGIASAPFVAFRISDSGINALKQGYDATDFDTLIDAVSNLSPDKIVQFYLNESIQTFKAGCYNASAVMLGVAAEKDIRDLILMYVSSKFPNDKESKIIKEVSVQRLIGRIFEEFDKQMERKLYDSDAPENLKDGYKPHLQTIYESLIKKLRDGSGHPLGVYVDRWEALGNIYLFGTFHRYCYELAKWFKGYRIR